MNPPKQIASALAIDNRVDEAPEDKSRDIRSFAPSDESITLDDCADTTVYRQTRTRQAETNACGKTIIIGEHAVIYGTKAVAMPLKNLRLHLSMGLNVKNPITQQRARSKTIQAVIDQAFDLLQQERCSYQIDYQSQIIIGAGLGSSAALCVALIRAMNQILDLHLSHEEISHFANKLECHFHGTSSGLDTAVVALEQIIDFNRGEKPQKVYVHERAKDQVKFALIDSKTRASTATMVQQAAPYFKGASGDRRVKRFNELALQTIHALKEGVIEELADAMNQASGLLQEVKVVSENLKLMIDQLHKIGVLAAKTTGAGGGGFLLALLDPKQNAQERALIDTFGSQNIIMTRLP